MILADEHLFLEGVLSPLVIKARLGLNIVKHLKIAATLLMRNN
jgi:hypothetical protein